jgi:hypothetical protein
MVTGAIRHRIPRQLGVAQSALFAVAGANSADVEARINQVIETPVAQAIERLVSTCCSNLLELMAHANPPRHSGDL